jgi:asparagine synthase (glutamine-hydrolysing)
MCGIAIAADLDGNGRAVPWALDLLRHRGPDGAGVFADPAGSVALEHSRLAIIDPDNKEANQPFADPSGRWLLVYNGEIFNFRELRRDLERCGISFRTESDTEVLLLGFIADGERFLGRLQGMYAFVIWDRATGELFAARDPVGVKPLYYTVRDGMFAAASELRALLAHPVVSHTLAAASVVEFLAFGNNFGDRTLVEGVKKLPPGHFVRARNGEVSVSEYWDVLPPEDSSRENNPAVELRERLEQAVEAAMVSDVPLGLMLSGGLDSSTIATLAARHASRGDLTAYSVAFGRPDDESDIARRLAEDLGLRHRVIRISEDDVREEFDVWLRDLDCPNANPTWIAISLIARAARADGIKVLLSGDGGDELFGGYNRWMKYLRFHDGVWARTPTPLRRTVGRAVRPWVSGLAGDIARRAATGDDLFVPSRPFHDDLLERHLGPAARVAAAEHPPESWLGDFRRRFRERLPGGDYLAWMSYVSFKTHLVEDYLQRLDKMGMQHSVEGRVPLLDAGLARWAFGLPQELKVDGFRQKALFRAAVTPLLPRYIVERPKQGFCPPVATWAEQLLHERIDVTRGPLVEAGLIDGKSTIDLARNGRGDSFAAWALGTLSAWSEQNLQAQSAAVRR